MTLDNLNDDPMVDVLARLRALETADPLGFSSITRGQLRVGGTAVLLVDSSGGVVIEGKLTGEGTFEWTNIAKFTGKLTATGETRFEGDTTQKGPFHVVGATDATGAFTSKGVTRFEGDTTQVGAHHVQGNQDITGTLAVKGMATLEKDLTLTGASARVVAGSTIITSNGTIGSTSSLLLTAATGITLNGAATANSSLTVSGSLLNPGVTGTTGSANVLLDAANRFYKITSASRFKVDAQPATFPDAILDVPIKDWLDAGQVERREAKRRIPGVIAEEVEAAGGALFVTYGDDDVIEGVAYDRLALARTQILAQKLEAALERIAALEAAAAG